MLKSYFNIPMVYRVAAGFVIGAGMGICLSCAEKMEYSWVAPIISFISPFGTVLISMLKMVVIPIVFFSIACGLINFKPREFGKVGTMLLAWYLFTSIFASFFGTFVAYVMKPTLSDGTVIFGEKFLDQVKNMQANNGGILSFEGFIANMFQNPFAALAEGNFLPIIIFSILFGLAARVVMDNVEEPGSVCKMFEMFKACQKICYKLTEWVMEYFPIGVLSLTMVQFAVYGPSLFGPYLRIASSVIVSILLMLFFIYPIFIFITTKKNPYLTIWKMREPIMTAFLTRSSAATLPVSLANAKKIGIRDEIASFSLPLGTVVNMDGICVHLPVFAILAINMLGLHLTILQVCVLVLSIVFVSIGASCIPGGSIFLLFMVLQNLGIDSESIALVVAFALGINPVLDMFETACNVAGDNVCSYIVARHFNMIDGTAGEDAPVSRFDMSKMHND